MLTTPLYPSLSLSRNPFSPSNVVNSFAQSRSTPTNPSTTSARSLEATVRSPRMLDSSDSKSTMTRRQTQSLRNPKISVHLQILLSSDSSDRHRICRPSRPMDQHVSPSSSYRLPLCLPFADWNHSTSPRLYTLFPTLSARLTTLGFSPARRSILSALPFSETPRVSKIQLKLNSKPFANIRQLQLIGTLSSNEPSVRRFFSSFDSLSTLSLFDTSYTSSLIQKLLEALPAPHHLDILNFGCRPRLDTSNRGDLARCFKSFTRLRALTLLSDFSSFTSDLYSDLRVLPIEILQFASKACVSIDRLTSLISGPTKHSTLKSIGLNQIKGRIGTSIRDVGEPYWDDLVSEWRPYPDWELPMWTEAFDEERLVEFLAIAKKQGLIVGGSAVDAIGVLAEREEEWRLLEGFVPERDESD